MNSCFGEDVDVHLLHFDRFLAWSLIFHGPEYVRRERRGVRSCPSFIIFFMSYPYAGWEWLPVFESNELSCEVSIARVVSPDFSIVFSSRVMPGIGG